MVKGQIKPCMKHLRVFQYCMIYRFVIEYYAIRCGKLRINCCHLLLAGSFTGTYINHKGLHRTANEYAEERGIYKDLISKNKNVTY